MPCSLFQNGDRDPGSIARTSSGMPANRHSVYILNCILVTTNLHERALFDKNKALFGPCVHQPPRTSLSGQLNLICDVLDGSICTLLGGVKPPEAILFVNRVLADSRNNADSPDWPPPSVEIKTKHAWNFITEHEVWLRRTAQIANADVALRIPFPCFDKVRSATLNYTVVPAASCRRHHCYS